MPETWQTYFTAHPDKGGVPLPDRFLTHHPPCLVKVFTTEAAVAPKATLLMGAPGSGKSRLLTPGSVSPNTVIVNPDTFKAKLPEFDGGKGASNVHEESSWLAHQVRNVAVARSCNLLNDAVGASAGKYADLVRKLRAASYSISLLCVHVLEIEELLDRVAIRALQSEHEADRGRLVPESVVRHAHEAVPKAFEALRHSVDAARMVDGTTSAVVYEQEGQSITGTDVAFLDRLGAVGQRLKVAPSEA